MLYYEDPVTVFDEIKGKLPEPYYRDDAVVIYHADCRPIDIYHQL